MKAVFTKLALQRRPGAWALGALLLLLLGFAGVMAARVSQRSNSAADPAAVLALTQRCQTEMLRGTCGAMNASAPKTGASRLFIAGVGEVDAAAFAALRAAGDQMCDEAAAACRQDWIGNTCRIARALYPVPGAGAGAGAGSGAPAAK